MKCTLLLSLLILLAGCSPHLSMEDYYIKGQDHQFFYCNNEGIQPMTESENGYYFFAGRYLYFADKESMKPIIVCSKPNCLHNEETDSYKIINCNALFEDPKSIFYDNKSLYVLNSNFTASTVNEFSKLSPDGTQRKTLVKFSGIVTSASFHRGVLYYATQMWDANGISHYGLYASKEGKKTKELYNGVLEKGNISDLTCYGGRVFFSEFEISNNGYIDNTMCYNIATNKILPLFKNKNMTSVGIPAFIKDKMYYRITTLNFPDNSLSKQDAFISDLDGQNSTQAFDIGFPVVGRSDGRNIYAHDIPWSPYSKEKETQALTIYSIDGNTINSVPTGNFGRFQDVLPGGEYHIFLQQRDGEIFRLYSLDKHKMIAGEAVQWQLLFESTFEKMYPVISTRTD